MTFPLVRDLAVDGIPVVVTCRVLKLCRQQFYRWLKSPVTQQEWDDAHLVDAAVSVHENDP
ncbi:MAG: IS3 family transposase, partial [Mycobacteriaceae bacterium]